jgi:hypothetical protein
VSDDRLPQTRWIVYAVVGGLLFVWAIVLVIQRMAYIFGGTYIH